jgi:hypothetical protein
MFDDDDGTLRLHVSNIPFTWSKEKLAEVFGVCILFNISNFILNKFLNRNMEQHLMLKLFIMNVVQK